MRKITTFFGLFFAVIAFAQFTEPGFYRVRNVGSDCYICIKGTSFNWSTNPDAFWKCIVMQNHADSAHVTDPGTVIYIPGTGMGRLYGQGVNTYELTGLGLGVDTAKTQSTERLTYVARIKYGAYTFYLRDYGNGLTAGGSQRTAEAWWWIEPLTEASMDTSYLGVKPADADMRDVDGYYWTTLCCDFPVLLPAGGGVEGAYTVQEVATDDDGRNTVVPVKVCGEGDTLPGATPVLLRLRSPYASGNKIIPVGEPANCNVMPVAADLLVGNYFSEFNNHSDLINYDVLAAYVPGQATPAAAGRLVLGVDADGNVGFFPQPDGTYMAHNTAWLDVETLGLTDAAAVYLVTNSAPEVIPGDTDGDGEVTPADISGLIDMLLDSSGTMPAGADVNGDGEVTPADISALIDKLLN